jgi:ATP-binding cassette, subfamily B, bacterial CvaB/MchF/RaxB
MLLRATVGIVAMFYLSPWLVLPGIATMAFAMVLDAAFLRWQRQLAGQAMLAQQQQRAMFYDVIPQLPVLRRFGVLQRARARVKGQVRRTADVQVQAARMNAIHSAASKFLTSVDQVVFLSLAAYFVKSEAYSLGVFVAAGLYKDLLSQSITSAFAVWQQYTVLEPQRRQVQEAYEINPVVEKQLPTVTRGEVRLNAVRFRYGTLDNWVIDGANLDVKHGECVVLAGGIRCWKDNAYQTDLWHQ